MEKLCIRTGQEGDLPELLALYRALDREMTTLQPEFYCAPPRQEEALRRYLEAADADFLVAEQAGQLLGFALVVNAGWTPEFSNLLPHRYAELYDLVVAPTARGQGIGSRLLAAAKRWARDRRLEYLELNVLSQNSAALRLYEAQDFYESSRTLRCML